MTAARVAPGSPKKVGMTMYRIVTAALCALLGLCACGGDVESETGQHPAPATERPAEKPAPVLDCNGQAHYTECALDQASGVCIFGKCRRSCEEDVDCDDGSQCTEDSCFWGYCRNDTGACG